MPITETLTKQINLPFVGGVSVAAVVGVVGLVWFLTRRKKSVKLTF